MLESTSDTLSSAPVAIRNGQSIYHAQGIFRLGSTKREGRELLLREYGGYSLQELIKEPGLFTQLMPGLFDAKLSVFNYINPHQGQRIFINLTPGQLKSPHLPGCIDRMLELLAPELKIVLEITENECVEDWPFVLRTLDTLKAKGVEIAVDDFGAGYANIKSLIEISPKYVKVDQHIIDKACQCTKSENFVYALVSFIHKLGMKAILEGIETPRHLAVAIKSRAEFGQGFYFERPQRLAGA